MKSHRKMLLSGLVVGICGTGILAEPDPNFHCYLLFGQSNMAGGAAGQYDGEGTKGVDDYCDTNPRVKVLAWGDCNRAPYPCPSKTLKRTHDQWYTAFPPYHNCHEGIGPADAFGKTLLDSIRADIKIGFIPCALSGQALEVFIKGNNRPIDSHTQPQRGSSKLQSNGYGWMIDRCKIAQKSGVIKGILFHQGEANSGNAGVSSGDGWVTAVANLVKDLKTDLNLSDSVPFIAGEMRYDGCCKSHNPYVNKLPSKIPKCAVASAEGIERRLSRPDGQTDNFHFSTKGTKDFGKRYGMEFLKLVNNEYIPRIGDTLTQSVTNRFVKHKNPAITSISIYTLDGRVVKTIGSTAALRSLTPGQVYLISRKLDNGRTEMVPFVKQ